MIEGEENQGERDEEKLSDRRDRDRDRMKELVSVCMREKKGGIWSFCVRERER